eukprot:superscaffoldBa00004695_g19313
MNLSVLYMKQNQFFASILLTLVSYKARSLPTYQSPSSINERCARGRVAQSVWLRPLRSCQSPRARSHSSCRGIDTRQSDGVTSEGAKDAAAAATRPELPSTQPSLRLGEGRLTTAHTSPIVGAVCGRDISVKIPEGQAEAGSLAAGKLRSLEDQLTRAKQKIHSFQKLTGDGPGPTQEELRRRVENGVKEFWYFVRSEVKKLANAEPSERQKYADTLLQDLGHQERSIMTDLYYLSQADGVGEWRVKEAKDLSDLVQNRITYLQNPPDCSKARKLVCNINKGCGYGCQLHHVVYCFMIAYGTQRTLILESHNWRYAPGGWETVFLPVSNTCTDRSGATTGHWSGEAHDKDVQVVELPIVDSLHPRPPYLPLAIPEDLAPRLHRLHGDPSVWWVSQFVKYLVRPQAWLEKEIQQTTAKLGFKHPIIGVHVRRTDKVGTEAAFHPIEEYMLHVEEQFQHLARRVHIDKKRVYLATDDPSLLQEAKTKYPDYEFISDNSISWSAGLHNRYTENSLRGVILDIHFLSQTDFLVCTFSSQ